MSFLRRRAKDPRPPEKPAAPEPAAKPLDRDLERPLESLICALRTWGRFEIRVTPPEPALMDDDKPAELPPFEQWARRAFSFTEGEAVDFDGLDRFVLEQRSNEQRAVDTALRDLREALWAFAEAFSRSLNEDNAGDGKTRGAVDRLRTAVAAGDVATIRREAVLTAQTVSSVLTTREQRQRDQIERLSAKLEDISNALVRAKRDGEVDPLTGLFNRAALDAHMKRLADLVVFMPNPPLLVVLDVDHFKWVNDKYGHDVGDLALRSVGVRLGATCRRGDDFVARFGGDEFVCVLDGVTPGGEKAQADRILFELRQVEVPVGKESLRLSCSMGLARARAGDAPLEWFRRADEALYRAKRAGRDRACVAEKGAPLE